MLNNRLFAVSTLVCAGLALAACSQGDSLNEASQTPEASAAVSTEASASSSAPATSSEHAHAHGDVHMHGAVVRAMEPGSDMTAVFGQLHNGTDEDVTITAVRTSVDAEMTQIHEVVDGVMQELNGGLHLAAGESVELKPGGLHFMLMGVKEPVMAGETVTLTLVTADGQSIEIGEVPVRDMGAGAEGYDDMHHGDHGHGDHGHADHKH
ncbi:copper chaperone PCu(A)C [Corynebacterium lizhenjunii]|uniref:Copper chaperone PCu(A)C n=1 Tax=Corynebacterium lizhenjunii TaxID=2709394 RepID=A0A7T0KDH3_9CORY|nr:copper chaperone PCu(A)C [Corynebacterium lizhenjunii]QPK78250.1 copper chaperone PCu(A)C [Corynebacterium lizhenjunii]